MAINFPISPSLNQIYSYNGLSWQWNGSYWQSFPPSSGATGVVRTLTASTGLSANTTTGDITILFTGSTGSVFTGGTVSGATSFTGGLSANTISATTYSNLPVSGLTSGNNIGVNNSNNNFTISFTGGSVSSSTNFTNGLTANTISATTYSNVPVVTGGTYTSGTITFTDAKGGTFNVSGLPVGGQGGQLYYFNTSVTQTPYKEFGPAGTTTSEQTTTISVASGVTSTIQSYLTLTH